MKYKITTLTKEVPKHIRLEVYKEALDMIGNKNHDGDNGLCLMLPMVLFDLKSYLDDYEDSETNDEWRHSDTPIAFPELTHSVIFDILHSSQQEKTRAAYLRQWIRVLEGAIAQTLNTEK